MRSQKKEAKIPEEELELVSHEDENIELEPISIFDSDEDEEFNGKELFGGDDDDDDDDLGDKFTLFDSEDEGLDVFGDDDGEDKD